MEQAKPKKVVRAIRAELPYKRTISSTPVAEDTAACTRKFGNAYEMVLVAAKRSLDIARGHTTLIKGHGPAVSALLEIENGTVDRTYGK
jgi:DNA-directed RNA polymerase subunit K/omega